MIHHGKSPQQLDSYINTKFNRLRNMTRFTKYDQILLKNQQEQRRPFHNHKAAVYHKDMTIINVCPPNNREPNEAKTQLKKTAGNSGRITVELTVSLRMSDGTTTRHSAKTRRLGSAAGRLHTCQRGKAHRKI